MKIKSVVTIVLLLFVAASVAALVVSELRSDEESPARPEAMAETEESGMDAGSESARTAEDQAAPPVETPSREAAEEPAPERRVVAFYFHRTKRCPTCLKIERYSEEALRRGFSEELEEGLLEWRTVNLDEAENEHFVQEFGLSFQSLLLVEMTGKRMGRWSNLEKVWDLVGDKAAFLAYVRKETRSYLHGE
jgi:hypothetical protein